MKKNNGNMNKKDLYGKANYDEQVVTIAKISIGVIIVLALVYLVTALATGEIKLGNKSKKDIPEATIQYEEIIAGSILNRQQDEYYVLAFNFTDTKASYYLSLKDSYKQNIDALPVYIVDLEKGFNNVLMPEENETYKEKPESINELKVKGPTILKVKKGNVTLRVEGEEKFTEELEKLAK